MKDDGTRKELGGEELLKLDNQLCFALYVTSKEIIKKYKSILQPYDLTYTGYITMLALWEKDNVMVKELGERLYLDSGTLTPLLKKLESKGFVERHRSMEDERNVQIRVTDMGWLLKESAVNIPKELICSLSFDPKDGQALLTRLHELMPLL